MGTSRTQPRAALWNESAAAYDAHIERYPAHRRITTLLLAALGDHAPQRVAGWWD